ncbi:MAG: LysR family transcriptional regulator [Bacillota bacterium]|nr:LysR family transcriptional regulator [Bacillota bacterium]
MEIRQLEYFLEVAKEENISRAAQNLYISQPSLSRVMKELEEELDTKLFSKSNRNTKLTNEGQLFLQRAKEIVSLVRKTEEEFQSKEKEVVGTIHIGAGETDLFRYIAKTVKNISLKYPKIRFEFYSGVAPEILSRIQDGLLEFGFLVEPIEIGNLNRIEIKEKDVFGLVVSKESKYANYSSISKEDLLDMPLIVARNQTVKSNDWFSDIFDRLNIVSSGSMPLNSIKLVEEGMGCFFSVHKQEYDTMRKVKFIPFEQPIDRKWFLVYKNYAQLPKTHQIFIEEFQKVLEE